MRSSQIISEETNSHGLKRAMAVFLVITSTLIVFLVGSISPESATESIVKYTASDDFVIARTVISNGGDVAVLAQRQRRLVDEPENASLAASVGTLSLSIFQATGNERFVGIARDALDPWWSVPEPPAELWLLRGRILQNRHHFTEAAEDFTRFNIAHPGRKEARLLQADAWRRAGEMAKARQACFGIALAGEPFLARYCAAEVLLTLGQYEAALEALPAIEPGQQSEVTSREQSVSIELERWGRAIEADILVASDRKAEALSIWRNLAANADLSVPEMLSYTDLLLDESEYQQVIELLQDIPVSVAVLLRRAVAMKALGQSGFTDVENTVRELLDITSMSESATVHLREQALSALWIDEDSLRATQLALENWQQQKGWEDAELVLMAARIAAQKAADKSEESEAGAAINEITQWRASWSGDLQL